MAESMFTGQLWFQNSEALFIELEQLADEGKDVIGLRARVERILCTDDAAQKERLATEFLQTTYAMPLKAGVAETMREPNELPLILDEADGVRDLPVPDGAALEDKILGAWQGRLAGCLLGKPFEGWMRARICGLLKATGNYPPKGYADMAHVDKAVLDRFDVNEKAAWLNNCDGMPEDDDTNYTTLALKLLDNAGREFTPGDVALRWLNDLPILHVCTAERVAYRNLVALREPPESAMVNNPYREWIGAQIRGDLFGYINPGRMMSAADMAWRDACISHVKNGIYGEMWAAATIAACFAVDTPQEAIKLGMRVIPRTSRLHAALTEVLSWPSKGLDAQAAIERIRKDWDETNAHHWCHTISNACICAAALLFGEKDLEKTLGLTLLAGFDTDCNGATCGSMLGAMLGAKALPQTWIAPLNDTLHTGVDGYNLVKITDMAARTMAHIQRG